MRSPPRSTIDRESATGTKPQCRSILGPEACCACSLNLRPVNLDVVTEVDTAANIVCDGDSELLFLLARQARVTISFFAIDESGDESPIATWTPVADQVLEEGVQRIELPVSRLPFGSYRMRLRAVAVNNGEEQEYVARASHREDRNDALPLAHSFVKGVNLANGSAVLSVQDIDLGGVGPSVSLERTYSTQRGDVLGVFGRGWSSNLESRVQRSACGTRTVVGGAGQGQRFAVERTEPDGTTVYRPLGGYNGALFERDGAYDFIAKDGTRYHYAEPALGDRRLSYIADPNGNRMTLEYAQRDTARVVIALHDDDGRSLRFDLALRVFKEVASENSATATQWVVTAARAPGELVLTYSYDEYGNLERANRPAGLREEAYAYRDVGWVVLPGSDGRQVSRRLGFRLVEARDALNGAVRTYEHAKYTTIVGVDGQVPLGATRVISIREPDTGLTRFDYVGQIAAPPVTVVTDARNYTTRYEMNFYGAVEVQTDTAGTTRTTWDLQRWQPQSITDANGRVTTYGYDRWGNKTLERIRLGDRTIERQWTYWPPETFAVPGIKNRENTATDGRGIVRTTTWDPRGNKASTTRGGITESWGWSARGLMDRYTDGFGATRTYGWDPFGFPRLEVAPEGGVTQWVYDERGRKTREIDANNGVTDFEYDARDRLVRVTHPVVANERATERIDYDDRLNTVTRTDPRNAVTVQTFDRMGRLLSERQATGETRTFTYDLNGNRATETDFRGNVTTLHYDEVNRLRRREEPLGRTTVYEYDAVGNRTAETVSGGDQPARRTEYRYVHPLYARTLTRRQLGIDWLETAEAYDDNGNRISLTDAEGRVTTFEYDDRDRLRFERRPLGQVVEYGYDGADRRTAETRSNAGGSGNQVRTWRFDGDGRLREQVDATGATTRFDYDRKGNRIRQTNARGAERTWTYDARDRVVSESGPVPGLIITYGLDANGNRISERQPTVPQANNITRTFDALNRLRRVEDSLGLVEAMDYDPDGHVLSRTNANNRVTTFVVDALGRVAEERRPLGRTWTRTWTVHGELLTETDPRNFETRHRYDTVGRRTATILPPREGSSAQEGPQWTYDRVGNVLTQRDARGNETTFVYDALNRRERETIAGVAVGGALAPVVRSWTYDTVGNVLTETDRRGIVTTYTWDRENRRKTTTRDGTLIERLDYDAVGNVVERTDANGTVTRTEYDPADRPKEQIAGAGTGVAATTRWTSTPLGDVLSITDPESRVTTQTWDQRRRLVRVENGAGEATAYEHDGLGQIRTITPPKGGTHASRRTYDAADRLQTIADGEGNTWTYGYNQTDQRTSITNPRGHATTFAFDGRGLLTAMTYPGGATWTYRHDADNHRISETTPLGVTRTYTVDALGRRRSAAYSPVIAGEATSTGWSYDENGNVLAVSDRIGEGQFITLTRTWDRRDRIASETDPFGRTLRYTYDAYGNRKSRIDVAADETTTYQYDARHRNISVTSRSHGTTALAWYRDDRLRTITQPGNVVSTTTWDRAGRVDTITHTANGTPLVTLSYDYDRNGNRDAETLAHAGQPPVVSTYTHDEADRLASMTVDGATTTYTLDGTGNRTRERTAPAGAPATLDRTCTFDPRDRLEGCTDSVSGVTETHGWDATGRRTSETVGGLTRTTTWDARDRLLTLTESGGPTTTYTYDPEGQRIESRRGAEGERVQYDAGHRHAETNGAGNVTRTYQATAPHRATSRGVWARAGAAAMTLFLGMADAGAIPTPRHYLHDAHGTPVAIATHEGALAQRSTWDVWGNPTQVETLDTGLTANPNRIGFTGYVLDLEGSRTSSGASATANSPISNARYYAKARYYGAGRGSFISVDPWDGDPTSPVSLNKYLYGYANPGVYFDPDGRVGIASDAERIAKDSVAAYDADIAQLTQDDSYLRAAGLYLGKAAAETGALVASGLNATSNLLARNLPEGYSTRQQAEREIAEAEYTMSRVIEGVGQTASYVKEDPAGASAKLVNAAAEFGGKALSGDVHAVGQTLAALPALATGGSTKLATGLRRLAPDVSDIDFDDLGDAYRPAGRAKEPAQVRVNQFDGAQREDGTLADLQAKYPNARIQRQVYLRTEDGKRAIDEVGTGEARRLDFVVIEDDKVIDVVETTSQSARKSGQFAKEQRIREAGGTYIRDRQTGCLLDACDVPTREDRRQ